MGVGYGKSASAGGHTPILTETTCFLRFCYTPLVVHALWLGVGGARGSRVVHV
jgi:hypothetical protein